MTPYLGLWHGTKAWGPASLVVPPPLAVVDVDVACDNFTVQVDVDDDVERC